MVIPSFDFSTSDFHQWAAYVLILLMTSITGFTIIMAIVLTLIRILYRFKLQQKGYRQDFELENANNSKSFVQFLRRDKEYQIVHIDKTGGKSVGICLEGGAFNPTIAGDPGIYVKKVKENSAADGKLFPGDRIMSINGYDLRGIPLHFATKMVRESEGSLELYVKRTPLRERRIKEAFITYKRDRTAVFTQQQIEEFEDGFSVYDRAGTGSIRRSVLMRLLRSLGYNLHEADVWTYMDDLGFTVYTSIRLQDFVQLMHKIVEHHHCYEDDIELAYSVFEDDAGRFLTVNKLREAMKRIPGRIKVNDYQFQEILQTIINGENTRRLREEIDLNDFKKLVMPTMKLY